MACTPAPACTALIEQAKQKWPGAQSYGICPSAEHSKANPDSDHERGEAVDLGHTGGVNTYAVADQLRLRCKAGLEPRVKYIISNWRIASAKQDWAWRPYDGGPQGNGHTSHMHVSILSAYRNDTRPWFEGVTGGPATGPTADLAVAGTSTGGDAGGLAGLASFGRALLDGTTWLRVLGIVAGIVLVIIAAVILAADTKAGRAVANVAGRGVVKLDGPDDEDVDAGLGPAQREVK